MIPGLLKVAPLRRVVLVDEGGEPAAMPGGGGTSVNKLTTTTRLPVWASGLYSATTSSTQKTGAITGTEVMLSVTTDTWVRVGPPASVVASKGAGSMFLGKGGPYTFQITSGQGVAFMADGAAGAITILPVA